MTVKFCTQRPVDPTKRGKDVNVKANLREISHDTTKSGVFGLIMTFLSSDGVVSWRYLPQIIEVFIS